MTKKFVIVTDSCSDLTKELREKYDIEYIPMHLSYDGKEIPASLDWEYISYKDFYTAMRNGTRFLTSQVNEEAYRERFEKYIADGYDVLSISCSSALSGSVKGSYAVRDQLSEKYPNAKIYCVDSLNSCFGLGMLCIVASKMRAAGSTIEETFNWLEENKLTANQFCTVESLSYLRRAGRVSAGSAVFGGLLDIKPIIISDVVGQNKAVEKVRGRKTSVKRLVSKFKETYESCPHQIVCIAHADCEEDGKLLYNMVTEALPDKNVEILFGNIGPIIGASAGPGTVAVYCFGKKVTE